MNIAILGYGTVGSGVYEVLKRNQEIVEKSAGKEMNVKYVLDLREFPGDPVMDVLVHDYNVILEDPEVQLVAEVMGGVEPAYTFTKKALEKGKSVCTSNKELVARHGTELIKIAREHGANYLFEASCGGGIPILRPLLSCLTADDLDDISGILNGTTNYMLTKMAKEGSDYDTVLKEAQAMGYAERNPEADVEGYDPGRKIAILSSVAFGSYVAFEDVYTEGITALTDKDFLYANQLNASVKLVATAKKADGVLYGYVAPVFVWENDPLYMVNDVFNAVSVHGNMLGETMYYGKGAGKLPTASAVVSDLIEEAKRYGEDIMPAWAEEKLELADIKNLSRRFFVRAKGEADMAKIRELFGAEEIIQVEGLADEYGFLTGIMQEKEFDSAAESFGCMIGRIRVRDI